MALTTRPVVFADVLPVPRVRARSVALVVTFALLTAAAAQVQIHLGFTPVPITGQTFAALLAGAALGSRLGAFSQITYVTAGLFLPFYAGGESGWTYASGATAGYLVGIIAAAFLVGLLAERKHDRNLITSVPAMLFGSAVIYTFGAAWLAYSLHLSATQAIDKGVAPFLIGDAVKALVAGSLLPIAWRISKG